MARNVLLLWHNRSNAESIPEINGEELMKHTIKSVREGKVGWVILWLLGVPIPVLILLFLIRGCT